MSFKKLQWNLYKVDTINAWQKCQLYGDFHFIESPPENYNSSKVNMKSTICHDFSSPDLLERPKLTETDPRKKARPYWTLQHPYVDIQAATRGCK